MGGAENVSVITGWWNGSALIPDYERAVAGCGAEVIAVDNASTPDEARLLHEMVERLGGVYLRNETNRYYGPALEQGMAVASRPILVCPNSDIRALHPWLPDVALDVSDDRGLYSPFTQCFESPDGWHVIRANYYLIAATRSAWEALGYWQSHIYFYPLL